MVERNDDHKLSTDQRVKTTLRKKVLILFAFIVVFQGGFLLTLLGLLEHTEAQLNEERHARDIVASIAEYISTLQTTSISLINQIRYEDIILDEYKEIFAQLPRNFKKLKELLENDPDAASRVKELEATTLESLDVIAKVNESYRQRDLSEQHKMLHNHYCIQLIDCSRSMTRQIDELENIYRERQATLGRALTNQSDNLIFLAVILGFAVNAIAAIAIYRFFVKGIIGRLNIVKANTINLAIGKPLLEPVKGDDEVAQLDRKFRQMHEKLEQVKSKESLILEHAANFICSVNRKSIIENVPEVCSAMWGYRCDELIGRRFNSMIVGDADSNTSTLASLSAFQSTANFENQIRCADGTHLDLAWSASLIDADSIVCIAQDITERKRYTAQLKQSEERFRTIEERMPIAVVSCDRNFVIESVNAAVKRTFQYQPNELLGKPLDMLLIDPSKRNSPASRQAEQLAGLGPETATEMSVWRRDGEQFTAEVIVASHSSSRGDRHLVCFRDVSARIELEKAKRDFVSMVSHDLRSPLTSLHGTLSMVSEAYLSSQGTDGVSVDSGSKVDTGQVNAESGNVFVVSASMVSRLVELINDFLDMGKIESGQEHLILLQVSVKELLVEAIEQAKGAVRERLCTIDFVLKELDRPILADSNAISVNVDYNRFVRCIACLIEVIVYSNQNQSEFSVEASVDADQVRIKVRGTSCMLPQTVKEVVNDGYALVELEGMNTSSPLSLALCRTVLRAHGGSLAVVGGLSNEMFEAILPRVFT